MNQPHLKGNQPVINITDPTWSLPIKTGGLQIFECRVSNIPAGQAEDKTVTETDKVATAKDMLGSVQDKAASFYRSTAC